MGKKVSDCIEFFKEELKRENWSREYLERALSNIGKKLESVCKNIPEVNLFGYCIAFKGGNIRDTIEKYACDTLTILNKEKREHILSYFQEHYQTLCRELLRDLPQFFTLEGKIEVYGIPKKSQ